MKGERDKDIVGWREKMEEEGRERERERREAWKRGGEEREKYMDGERETGRELNMGDIERDSNIDCD